MNNIELFEELQQDAHIDKHRLDDEACNQTMLYSKWSKRLAVAQDNLRRKELELTQYKARKMLKEKEVRKTDKASEHAYRMSSNYASISTQVSKLQRRADLLQTAVHTMLHRRSMIECLTKLKASDYYS